MGESNCNTYNAKGILYREYKKVLQINQKITNNPSKKVKNIHFTEKAQIANKIMKRYTDSLITGEMQIKATIKIKETNIKNSGSTGRGGEAVDPILTAGGSINQPDHFRKLFGVKGEDSYSLLLSSSPLKVIPQRNYCLAGDVLNVESSSVYKSNFAVI